MFGVFNDEVKVEYAIYIARPTWPNHGFFVTKVNKFDQTFETKKGEKVLFFTNKEEAEELATLMNCKGHCVFVMEVPELQEDYFNKFQNK